MARQVRLPLAPLVDYLCGEGEVNVSMIAECVGMSRSIVNEWRNVGVPIYRADSIAGQLHAHPADIWRHDWWEIGALQTEREVS